MCMYVRIVIPRICCLPSSELTCGETEMVLVLPISSLLNINVTDLQLNNNSCPVTSNSTHLMARISLDGCGTQRVVTCSPFLSGHFFSLISFQALFYFVIYLFIGTKIIPATGIYSI